MELLKEERQIAFLNMQAFAMMKQARLNTTSIAKLRKEFVNVANDLENDTSTTIRK